MRNWTEGFASMLAMVAAFGVAPAAFSSELTPAEPATQPATDSAASRTQLQKENPAPPKLARLTVPVSINGSAPVPFVVDTGSERTVISTELGERLGLTKGPQLKLATVSGLHISDSFRLDRLQMNDISVAGIEAPALKRSDMGAYGLLGVDSLGGNRLRLDFQRNVMTILPAAAKTAPIVNTPDIITVVAKKRAGRLVLTGARLNGMKIDVVIDTGAQNSMGNRALRKKLKRSQRSGEYSDIGLQSVTGEVIDGDYTLIRKVTFGNVKLSGLPVTFTQQHAFDALNLSHRPALLLGMDALRLFDSVEIDFVNRRVAFDMPGGSRRQSSERFALKDPSGE